MQCPKCGAKWYVSNTAVSGDSFREHLVAKGKFVEWYTHDYIVRTRTCRMCKTKSDTIEVEIKDLGKMLEIAASEGLSNNMLKAQGSKPKQM